MTALNPNADESSQPGTQIKEVVAASETVAAPEAPAAPAGDPATLGLPSFIVGSVALGLVLVGMVPADAVRASLPIILAATAAGLFLATIWSANLGQSAVASVFGIFAGFWLSYAVLVLGLTHNWFGISAAAATSTQELFLTSWLIVVVMLTLATLRLPLAFTVVFALIAGPARLNSLARRGCGQAAGGQTRCRKVLAIGPALLAPKPPPSTRTPKARSPR